MANPEFMDFHMIVNKVSEQQSEEFVTVVADAPVSRFGMPFGQLGGSKPWRDLLLSDKVPANLVQDAGGYRLEQVSAQRSLSEQQIKQLGKILFELLFPPGSVAYDLLGRSCQCVNQKGAYLRLKLDLHSDLSNLPWETLNPSKVGNWAAEINKARKVVVRYLGNIYDSDRRVDAAGTAEQKSLIIVKADPKNFSNAEITRSLYRERDRIINVLRELSDWLHCEVIEEKDTLRELSQCVERLESEHRPVIGLHFMGHGGIDEEGGFFLGETEQQEDKRIYEDELRVALDRAESIRWIILNACNTAEEPIGCPLAGLATSMAVLKNIPTVIAYKRPVETTDAENLAADFYKLVLKQGLAIEDVIRSVQGKYKNPGGLVILQRSVEGRVQEAIRLGVESGGATTAAAEKPPARAPEVKAEAHPRGGPAPITGRTATPPEASETGRMVLVPAGPFMRGLSQKQLDFLLSQFRQHNLPLDLDSARKTLSRDLGEVAELPAFYIDVTPVTNAQFQRFVEQNNYRTEAERTKDPLHWKINNTPATAEHPVIYVSYADAEAYCNWAGKRLPTADEWKKAYRGTEGRIYPWGDIFSLDKCNTAESNFGETTPVTRFPEGASPYGCLDMVGNAEEWAASSSHGSKIILGGSWAMSCEVYGLPILHRLAPPSFYSNDLGFRCARDASK